MLYMELIWYDADETASARNFAECERRRPPPLTFSKVPCKHNPVKIDT